MPRLSNALPLLSDVALQMVDTEGTTARVALERGDVDIAMLSADAAYRTYARPSSLLQKSVPTVAGIAVLNVNTLYLAVAGTSSIRSLSDLPGHRIGILPPDSTGWSITEPLLTAAGISLDEMHAEVVASQEDAATRLLDGTLDGAFISLNSSVHSAARSGARLVSINGEWLEELRLRYPFLQGVFVPAGTFVGQREPLETVGIDLVLACGDDLDAQLVYRITHAYFEALQKDTPTIDLERAPATPIPLHPGAARYYRERALAR